MTKIPVNMAEIDSGGLVSVDHAGIIGEIVMETVVGNCDRRKDVYHTNTVVDVANCLSLLSSFSLSKLSGAIAPLLLLFLMLSTMMPLEAVRLGRGGNEAEKNALVTTNANNNNNGSGGTNNSMVPPPATRSSNDSDGILRCLLYSGNNSEQKAVVFYVPAADREIYESGVEDLQRQAAVSATTTGQSRSMPSLRLTCSRVSSSQMPSVLCSLCLYSEISSDLRHMVQGQVRSLNLSACMNGSFENASRMHDPYAEYHPVCYVSLEQTQNDK